MIRKLLCSLRANPSFNNLVIYGIGQGFNLITPLLVVPYVVHICSESGYGKISVALAVAFFLIVFVDYGSDIVGVKDVAVSRDNKEQLVTIFTITMVSKFVLLCAVCAVSSVLFLSVPFFAQDKALYFFSLSILVAQSLNPSWFLQGIERFTWITIINIISKGLYIFGIYLFVSKPEDYVLNNLIWGFGMFAPNVIALLLLMREYQFSFTTVKWHQVRAQIRGNFTIFGSQIFVSLQMYSPIMLIGYFGSSAMAGQYKIVDQVIVIFKTYVLLFSNYVYPKVCYLLEKSSNEGLRFWRRYNGANLIFIALSMACIFISAHPIVAYFNPRDPNAIVPLLRIAVCIPLIQAVAIPLRQLVIGWNHQKYYARLVMWAALLCMLLIAAVLPFFEVTGVLFVLMSVELFLLVSFFACIKSKLFPV